MRKISKSRTEDDVVTSTNGSGSLANEDQEANQSVDRDENNIESKDKSESCNDNNSENSKDVPSNKNKTTKKRKSGRHNKSIEDSSSEAEAKEQEDVGDDNLEEFKGNTKKTSKGKAKVKPKKTKTSPQSKKNDEDEEEYEVESIIDSKRIRGKLHYLIRWKGYGAESDSWEPHDTLSCPDMINKYNEEKENPPKKSNKRKANKKDIKIPAKRLKTNWDSKNADENAEYEVERILEVHHKKNGEREFLIHWKGWSNKFDSWEPEENLNCPDLIKKFMEKVNVARSNSGRTLRVAPQSTHRFTLQDPSSGRRLSKRRGQRQRVRYDNAE